MCRLVREHSPQSTIVVGGHVAAIPGVERMIDADHIVKGEGIRWFREFLGEPVDAPIAHPAIPSLVRLPGHGLQGAARRRRSGRHHHPVGRLPDGLQLLHDLGVLRRQGPVRQLLRDRRRSCSTSCATPNAAGRAHVLHDGRELPAVQEARARAARRMKRTARRGRCTSSPRPTRSASTTCGSSSSSACPGCGWGSSRRSAGYAKLKDTDTRRAHARAAVARHPRAGLDDHRPGAPHAREHRAARSSTPSRTTPTSISSCSTRRCPGTPLHAEMAGAGADADDVDLADIHGQYKFNFRHAAHLPRRVEGVARLGVRARLRRNGPSLYRMMRTTFEGWKRYGRDGDARVRARVNAEADTSGTDTAPRCGRWSGIFTSRTRRSARAWEICAARLSTRSVDSRGSSIASPAPCCSGRPGAKRRRIQPAALSSRRHSLTGATLSLDRRRSMTLRLTPCRP